VQKRWIIRGALKAGLRGVRRRSGDRVDTGAKAQLFDDLLLLLGSRQDA
jgi:hypothetical protein